MTKRAKEQQYDIQFDALQANGPVVLGPTPSHLWRTDPRHLCFLLSRYKFCSKLLAGKKNVLEIGCGDAFGTRLVLQTVKQVHGIDFDPLFINWANKQYGREKLHASFEVLDITKGMPKNAPYDAAYALDFIEHIPHKSEDKAMANICRALHDDAVCVIGTPNITASSYAGRDSAMGHINLKSAESLQTLLGKYFKNIFIFCMNDEVMHTGFHPMAHYLFGLGVGNKNREKRG